MRNYYYLTLALIGVFLAWPLAAQEADAPATVEASEDSQATETANDDAEASETAGAAESTDVDDDAAAEIADVAIDLDDPDDIDLDDQTYEQDDDDFVPTQEIPVGELIAFPSNI